MENMRHLSWARRTISFMIRFNFVPARKVSLIFTSVENQGISNNNPIRKSLLPSNDGSFTPGQTFSLQCAWHFNSQEEPVCVSWRWVKPSPLIVNPIHSKGLIIMTGEGLVSDSKSESCNSVDQFTRQFFEFASVFLNVLTLGPKWIFSYSRALDWHFTR